MVSQLNRLQRKIRFQKWKYVVAAVVMSFASISVTLTNSFSHEQPVAVVMSQSPSLQASPRATPVNFIAIITALDQRRREAFEEKDFSGLSLVNETGSPQAELDENLMKRIIKRDLSVEFVNARIVSALPMSQVNDDADEVLLEVKDRVNEVERVWKITLVRQADGSWRYRLVRQVPLEVQKLDPDEQK